MKLQGEINTWMEDRLEAYVDNSLPAPERALFEARALEDASWLEAIELSRQIGSELRSLQAPPCPDAVVEAAFARARRQPGVIERLGERLRLPPGVGGRLGQTFLSPALALALVLIVAIAIIRPWQTSPPPPPQQAEIDAALAEVKWTLAYIDGVGARAGSMIREQVFADGVVRPIRAGIETSFDKQSRQASAN